MIHFSLLGTRASVGIRASGRGFYSIRVYVRLEVLYNAVFFTQRKSQQTLVFMKLGAFWEVVPDVQAFLSAGAAWYQAWLHASRSETRQRRCIATIISIVVTTHVCTYSIASYLYIDLF